jgi:hypothetical protein
MKSFRKSVGGAFGRVRILKKIWKQRVRHLAYKPIFCWAL